MADKSGCGPTYNVRSWPMLAQRSNKENPATIASPVFHVSKDRASGNDVFSTKAAISPSRQYHLDVEPNDQHKKGKRYREKGRT
ncbi:hypothetical protein ACG873_24060 [Mesorhizobium sp. AaZ16]|uniref:hypothetical protein n=1 Tax=Mesorhizobium sp. AaZ16 TaxID=3402289 RepID=UPI00374E6722